MELQKGMTFEVKEAFIPRIFRSDSAVISSIYEDSVRISFLGSTGTALFPIRHFHSLIEQAALVQKTGTYVSVLQEMEHEQEHMPAN